MATNPPLPDPDAFAQAYMKDNAPSAPSAPAGGLPDPDAFAHAYKAGQAASSGPNPTALANQALASYGIHDKVSGPPAPSIAAPKDEGAFAMFKPSHWESDLQQLQEGLANENAMMTAAGRGAPMANPVEAASPVGPVQAATGAYQLTQPGKREEGASNLIEGTLATAQPLMYAGAIEAPVPLAAGLAAGALGQSESAEAARAAGASPAGARLAGDVGGLVAGGLVGGPKGIEAIREGTSAAPAEAAPAVSPDVAEWLTAPDEEPVPYRAGTGIDQPIILPAHETAPAQTAAGLVLPTEYSGLANEVSARVGEQQHGVSPSLQNLREQGLGGVTLPETQELLKAGEPFNPVPPTASVSVPDEATTRSVETPVSGTNRTAVPRTRAAAAAADTANTRSVETGKRTNPLSDRATLLEGTPQTEADVANQRLSEAANQGRQERGRRLISQDAYEQASRNLARLPHQLNSGLPLDSIPDLLTVAAYHLENGLGTFADWSGRMVRQFGDAIRPHLEDLYERVRAGLAGENTGTEPESPASHEDIISRNGGEFVGHMENVPGKPGLVLFNDPQTGSTLALPEDQVSDAAVQRHMAESRAKFAPQGGTGGTGPSASFELSPEGKIRVGVANPEHLGKTLAHGLYSGDMSKVIPRELIQNATDAIRGIPDGHVNVHVERHIGGSNHTVTVTDNGHGMTPEQVASVFTDIGSSGKSGAADASGGFGIAKAAILLGGEHVKIVTVANDNGKLVRTTLAGTPDEMRAGVTPQIEVLPAGSEPTGTSVSVTITGRPSPGDTSIQDAVQSATYPGRITASKTEISDGRAKTEPIGEQGGYRKLASGAIPGGTADVYAHQTRTDRSYAGVHSVSVGNNGLHQLSEHVLGSIAGNDYPHTFVDVRPNVEEGHPQYPFKANREEMTRDAAKAVRDLVLRHVIEPVNANVSSRLKVAWESMPSVETPSGSAYLYSPDTRISEEELRVLQNDPPFVRLADAITNGVRRIDASYTNKANRVGIVLSRDLHGVNLMPEEGEFGVFVNPFEHILASGDDAQKASGGIFNTIVHELAHNESRGHDASFAGEMGRVYANAPTDIRRSVEDDITSAIREARGSTGSGLDQTLRNYQEIARRKTGDATVFRGTEQRVGPENTVPNSGGPETGGSGVPDSTEDAVREQAAAVEEQPRRLVSEESYQQARKNIAGMANQLNAGIPVNILPDLVKIGVYHLENGARSFADWSNRMVDHLGEKIRPYLQDLYQRAVEESTRRRGTPPPAALADASEAQAAPVAANSGQPSAAGAAPARARTPITPQPVTHAAAPPETGTVPAFDKLSAEDKERASRSLDYLDTPEGERADIYDLIGQNVGKVNAQRRGKISVADTEAAARKLIESGTFTEKQAMKIAKGHALNAEQASALGNLVRVQRERLKAAADASHSDPSIANQAAFVAEREKFVAMYQRMQGVRSELGRALNIQRYARQAMADPTMPKLQKVMDLLGKKGVELTEEERKLLAAIPENDVEGMRNFMRDAVASRVSTLDKVFNYWVANILSAAKIVLVKGVSDLSLTLADIPARAVAGALDAARAQMGIGGSDRTVYSKEAIAAASGYWQGGLDGWRKAMQIMKTGDASNSANFEVEIPTGEYPGGLKNPYNINPRLFRSITLLFKSMAFQGEINAQAIRAATREGLKGDAYRERVADLIQNPTPEMVESASDRGKYNTLTRDPDELLSRIYMLRNAKQLLGAGKFIMPIAKTAYWFLHTGLDFSPLSAVDVFYHGIKDPKTLADPEAMTRLARSAIGTASIAGLYQYAKRGNITGAVPEDSKKRAEFYGEGKQPYSILVDGKWYSYEKIPALSVALSMAAALADSNDEGSKEWLDRAIDTGAAVGEMFVQQPMMAGISGISNALENPKRYASPLVAQFLGGFVPLSAFLREAAHAADPNVRLTRSIYDRLKAGLPITSETLPASYDSMGRPILRRGQAGAMAYSPMPVSDAGPLGPADKLLAQLDVYPSSVPRSIVRGRERIELTPAEYEDLQKTVGTAMRKVAERLVANGEFPNEPSITQREVMQAELRDARYNAEGAWKERFFASRQQHHETQN